MAAIGNGIDPALVTEEANRLKAERDTIDAEIQRIEKETVTPPRIDVAQVRRFLDSFTTTFDAAQVDERRKLVRTLVDHLELDPKTQEIRGAFYPDPMVKTFGARGGT